MPIYAPTLPPRPEPGQGLPPVLVIARFDLARILRQKLGRFFGFFFLMVLIVLCAQLYFHHLMGTRPEMAGLRSATQAFLPQGAPFQANLLHPFMISVLWLQVALVGGGLVARDTLHRIRPLIYAHPVAPRDYLAAKGLLAAGLPLAVMLPYVLLPWLLSLSLAGASGPVWLSTPLRLLPALLAIAALMGSVTLGASSLGSSPRAGFGWALGVLLGTSALAGVLAAVLGDARWMVLSVGYLTKAWPGLMFGLNEASGVGWISVAAGTLFHILIWTGIALWRTRPSEAVL
jgi:hypothetical protein